MLELKNISKSFKNNEILDNINFKFEPGKIYSIKGRNGSGKTVLLKCICGLLSITNGNIFYNGKELGKDFEILPNIGVIIESPIFWKDKTGFQTLDFLSSIKRVISKEEIISVLKLVGLYEYKDVLVKKYSLGMKQRLAIAQAIMENPQILLLDEPINSLDEEGIEMFKAIMKVEKEKGKIIIIVSHIIEDIVGICDYNLVLSKKRLSYNYKYVGVSSDV